MGWKCTPQIKGLIRGKVEKTEKKTGKRRGNGKAFFLEAGEERVSQSETLDRSRSHLNTYEGYTSGLDAWLDLKKEADEYEAPVVTKKKVRNEKTGEMEEQEVTHFRKLREDAVIGFAVIFNPPHEATHGEDGNWDQETYEKFYSDSWDVLHELYPDIFRDDNVIMSAVHRDEGYPVGEGYDPSEIDEHMHKLGRCRDENGRWIGKQIDYKMFDNINANYPRMMRERGWSEMEDLDVTDRKRMKEDPEYKAERKKKKKFGKSTNKYIHDKTKENLCKSEDLLEQSEQLSKENQEKSDEIELTRSKQKKDQKKLDDEIAENQQKKIQYANAISNMNNQIQENQRQQILITENLKKEYKEKLKEAEEQMRNDLEERNRSELEKAKEKAREEVIRNSAQVIEDEKEKLNQKFNSEIESAKTKAGNEAWNSANDEISTLKDDLQKQIRQTTEKQNEAEEAKKKVKSEALEEVQKKWYQELEAATPEYFNKFLASHAIAVHPKDRMGMPIKDKWVPANASKAFSHFIQQEASRTKSRVNEAMPEVRETEDQNEVQKQ